MDSSIFGLIDILLIVSVALINYCFFCMWKMLYGGWFHLRPTWKWLDDFQRLKLLASNADSVEVRQKCQLIINGFYLSCGLFLLCLLIGFIK